MEHIPKYPLVDDGAAEFRSGYPERRRSSQKLLSVGSMWL